MFYKPNEYLKRLRVDRLKTMFKYLILEMGVALSIWVLYACISNEGFIDRFNECLKNHDIDYCNKVVK